VRPDDLLLVVRVPNVVLLAPNPFTWLSDRTPPAGLPKAQRHALAAMRHGTAWSNKSLREAYPIDCRQATTVLAGLVSASLAEAVGAGSTRAYRLARPQPPNTPAPAGRSTKSPTHPQRLYTSRQDDARALLATLAQEGPATLAELSVKCGLTARQVKYAVQLLREDGRVELHGGRGSRSLYSAGLGPCRPAGARCALRDTTGQSDRPVRHLRSSRRTDRGGLIPGGFCPRNCQQEQRLNYSNTVRIPLIAAYHSQWAIHTLLARSQMIFYHDIISTLYGAAESSYLTHHQIMIAQRAKSAIDTQTITLSHAPCGNT
jgi:hypothetical protein